MSVWWACNILHLTSGLQRHQGKSCAEENNRPFWNYSCVLPAQNDAWWVRWVCAFFENARQSGLNITKVDLLYTIHQTAGRYYLGYVNFSLMQIPGWLKTLARWLAIRLKDQPGYDYWSSCLISLTAPERSSSSTWWFDDCLPAGRDFESVRPHWNCLL